MEDKIANKSETACFTFGDAVPVLDGRDITGLYQSWYNGRYFEPPISLDGLAKTRHASVHHESAMGAKVNILTSCFRGHPLMSHQAFRQIVLDYVVFGNAYVERIDNMLGQPMTLKPALAKMTRVTKDNGFIFLKDFQDEHVFLPGTIYHFKEVDLNQEIYGVPQYLSALQSIFLNEAATLFRRRYYLNGSHAGYILNITDAAMNDKDIDAIRKALKESKGPGNFRNLFLYTPNGDKDGVKVIPVSEAMAKDEFLNVKNVTRDDILTAHRVPPELMSIIPANVGGFGKPKEAAAVFNRNEIEPMKRVFTDLNHWLGGDVITFDKYEIDTGD